SASHNEYVFTGSRRFGTPTVLPAIHDLHAGSGEPRYWIRTAQDAVSRRGSGETGRSARWPLAASGGCRACCHLELGRPKSAVLGVRGRRGQGWACFWIKARAAPAT